MNSQKTILFLTMMEQETNPILLHLNLEKDTSFDNPFCFLYTGKYKNFNLFLLKSKKDPKYNVESVGTEIAAIMAYMGISQYNPDLIINAGSCGGVVFKENEVKLNNTSPLNYPLHIGDVCVTDEVRFFDREIIIPVYREYLEGKYDVYNYEEINKKLNFKKVVIGTTNSFLNDDSIAKKKGVDVAEMECAAIGRVCFLMNKKLVLLKVISDIAETDIFKRKKMFEECLDSVSEILAKNIKQFLDELSCLDKI